MNIITTVCKRACSWIEAFMIPYMPGQYIEVDLYTISGQSITCTLPGRSQNFPHGVVTEQWLINLINQQIRCPPSNEWSCIGCGNSSDLSIVTRPILNIINTNALIIHNDLLRLNITIPRRDFSIYFCIDCPLETIPKRRTGFLWTNILFDSTSLFEVPTFPWVSMKIKMSFYSPNKPQLSCELDNPNLDLTHGIRDFAYEMMGLWESMPDDNINIGSLTGLADIPQEDLDAMQMCLHYYTSPLIRRYWSKLAANFTPYFHYFAMSRDRTDSEQTTFEYKTRNSDPLSAPRNISVPLTL